MGKLDRVLSGFQDGIDMAGIRAALACGLPVGGYMPRGFKTESGPKPEYAILYGAMEHESPKYEDRTVANLRMCDGVILMGDFDSPGSRLVLRWVPLLGKACLKVVRDETTPRMVAEWAWRHPIATVMVAGNRASKLPPGFEERAEAFLAKAFSLAMSGPPPGWDDGRYRGLGKVPRPY